MNYKTYHDLYIPKADGTFSQIDHVVLSENGIFVLETKNYDGWIFGDEKSKYWTQVLYKSKNRFLNPIWQNKGHIKALKEWLGEEKIPYHSIVVFLSKAKFKKKMEFKDAHVIYLRQLNKTIGSYIFPAVEAATLQNMISRLDDLQLHNHKNKKDLHKKHVSQIKTKHKMQSTKTKANVCPRCDGELIIRKGKYGKFKGCKNYPSCRYTLKL